MRECINWSCYCFYRTAAADLCPCEPPVDTHRSPSLFTVPLKFATWAPTWTNACFPGLAASTKTSPLHKQELKGTFRIFQKGTGGWVGSGECAFASGKSAWDGETGELSAVQRYSKSWVHSTPIIWAFRRPSAGAETWPVGYAVAPTAMHNDRDKPLYPCSFRFLLHTYHLM